MEIGQLRLDRLHETHAGVTPEVNAAYLQAAAVCLGRFHEPPRNVAVSSDQGDDADEKRRQEMMLKFALVVIVLLVVVLAYQASQEG